MNTQSQTLSSLLPGSFWQSEWGSRFLGNRLPILAYHSISTDTSDDLAIPSAVFHDQMQWLRSQNVQVISLEQALAKLTRREELSKCVVLTFDDGFVDFIEHAVPILESCGFKAALFVVTGKTGQKSDWNYNTHATFTLSLADLRVLHTMGYGIGSHSASHPFLTRLSPIELAAELNTSRLFLEHELGISRPCFAYPYGIFSNQERQAVVDAGYVCACAAGGFWGNGYTSDHFALHRFIIRQRYSMRDFQAIVGSIIKWPLLVWPWQKTQYSVSFEARSL